MGSSGYDSRRAFLLALAPWLAGGIFDCALTLASPHGPEGWQYVLEILLILGLGRAQWVWGRGWLRSPLVAGLVLLFFAIAPHTPKNFPLGAPFLIGWMLPAWLGVRWLHAHSAVARHAAAGVVWVLLVVAGAKWADSVSLERETVGFRASAPAASGRAPDSSEPRRFAEPGVPVVIVSVDTLRADDAAEMQSVAYLTANGAYWPRAMSTSSWTLPALASLQTGLSPQHHGAACLEDGHCQGLHSEVTTLAESLSADGWRTAAFVGNPWAGRESGLSRGFQHFVEPGKGAARLLVGGAATGTHVQDDERTINAALDWLDRAPGRGFYLWVHLMGPHMPYLHAEDERLRTLDPVMLRSAHPMSEERKSEIRQAYRNEVRHTDRQVMRLLAELERKGVLSTGIVVFTSDHGEEFWEHGGVEHGHSHHGEVIDVPLLLVAPGVPGGTRSGTASLVDVVPTVHASVGMPFAGVDLRTGPPASRVASAWGGMIQRLDCSARNEKERALAHDCSVEPWSRWLYELEGDPSEYFPSRLDEGHELAMALSSITPPDTRAAFGRDLPGLRALGYLQ